MVHNFFREIHVVGGGDIGSANQSNILTYCTSNSYIYTTLGVYSYTLYARLRFT